jgi:GAF domain-containing protein
VTRESLLIATLVELADTLVDDFDVIDVLTVLSHRCVEAIDVDAAGVLLVSPQGALQFVASSSELMKVLELFQIQVDEGPCVDAFRTGEIVVNPDLADPDSKWPRFSPRALELGFESVYCLPMRLRGQVIGALNLFRTPPGTLDDDDVIVAQGFADMATIAILQHRTTLDAATVNSQLNHALNSRIAIEQAKGKVGEALGCDMDEAFARLRAHARNHNRGLTDVANAIVGATLLAADLDDAPQRGRSRP